MDRPHTGRRRNEAARAAILDAALRLLRDAGSAQVTVDAVAAEAGVGKQTIYRWWHTKGEVFLEAIERLADAEIPVPDTGSLASDLEEFLDATFRRTEDPAVVGALRAAAIEAAGNAGMAEALGRFAARRREVLAAILLRGGLRGELVADADPALMVDQVFGLLWYRVLGRHRGFGPDTARQLTRSLLAGNGC